MPSIAIIGASADRQKFGNKCVRAYHQQGWEVFPVNPGASTIEGLRCHAAIGDVPAPIDRISIYLPPALGLTLLEAIAAIEHTEFFVNPGAESPEFLERAAQLGLSPMQVCSLVEIGVSPSSL
jgi:hypothetical protein